MNDLAGLYPVIEANAATLKKPGVIAVRPGYMLDANGLLTTNKAVVVVVDPKVPRPDLPANVVASRLTSDRPTRSSC
jgi:hypothetical protein